MTPCCAGSAQPPGRAPSFYCDTRISAADDFTLRGVTSGTKDIIKENTGTLRLFGNNPNTFSGDLWVRNSTVELDKGAIGATRQSNHRWRA